MTYSVRQVEALTDDEQLLQLWKRNLELEGDLERRFAWYYIENPAGPGISYVLEHEADGVKQVVGSAGLNLRTFWLNGKAVSAGIMGDFNVDRAHRSLFPAFRLQRAICGHARKEFGFSYGFPNKMAEPVLRRSGFKKLGMHSRYSRPLRSAEYVGKLISNRLAARGISWGADLLMRELDRGRSLPARLLYELQWLPDVDERFDQLWRMSRGTYQIIGNRGADAVRWRYCNKTDEDYDVVAICHRRSDMLMSYAVIQPELSKGVAHLRDCFGKNEQCIDLLLSMLLPQLRDRGFSSVSISFLGPRWFILLLQRHGFFYREDDTDKVVVVDAATKNLGIDEARLLDQERWYLTEFDEDE